MRSKPLAFASSAFALVLLLSACSGDSDAPVSAASEAQIPVQEEPPPTCPLTGVEVGDEALLKKPAVAVKIENSPEARPQSGLEDADLVYEEIVEGGITRFMAIYHCGTTDQAGPVRSARFDDPKIAKPFTSALVYSGANGIVQGELQAQGLLILNETTGGDLLFRDPPGSYTTHNLFADVRALRKLRDVKKISAPKGGVFAFGDIAGKGKKARAVKINFTASNTIEYRWENDAWARFEAGAPFMSAAGSQIAVSNLLVQIVDVNNSTRIRDVAGNPSPDIDLLGEGNALLFRDGKVIKGTWRIAKGGAAPTFTTKGGDDMVFAPGAIWVELVPSSSGSVKGSVAFSKRAAGTP